MSKRPQDAFDEENVILQIKQYDEEINQLEEQLEIRRGERSRLQTQLDLFRASIAPINRLSDDILVMVFSEVILGFPMAVGGLLFVCRAWYQLVTNQPTLWSRIASVPTVVSKNVKLLTNYVNSAVRYSANVPLDVHIDLRFIGTSGFWARATKALIDMDNSAARSDDDYSLYARVSSWAKTEYGASTFPLVVDHIHLLEQHFESLTGKAGEVTSRWRSLTIWFELERFTVIDFVPLTFFDHPSPILESLTIELPCRTTSQQLSTFLPHTPRLRSISWVSNHNNNLATLISCKSQVINLQVHQIELTDTLLYTTLFENIQTMHLYFEYPRNPILSNFDVAPLALHYPQLQELTIVGYIPGTFIDGLDAPKLHKLCLLDPEDALKVLDSSLRCPHLRTLSLHASVPDIVGVCERFMARFKTIQNIALLHDLEEVLVDKLREMKRNGFPATRGYRYEDEEDMTNPMREIFVD